MNQTKKKLFENAVKLFSEKGYENVSTRELCASVNIQDGSLYNHYSSKEEILNTIFDKFAQKTEEHFLNECNLCLNSLKDLSPREILSGLTFPYSNKNCEYMIQSYRIISRERYTNSRAREIFTEYIIEYPKRMIKETIDTLIEYRKFPKIDTDSLSTIWTYTYAMSLLKFSPQSSNNIKEELQQNEKEFLVLSNFLIDNILNGL
jgi:AcrR family transcriptional regulator